MYITLGMVPKQRHVRRRETVFIEKCFVHPSRSSDIVAGVPTDDEGFNGVRQLCVVREAVNDHLVVRMEATWRQWPPVTRELQQAAHFDAHRSVDCRVFSPRTLRVSAAM